ncbi:reverse transcriptase domain-containing protein [Tanacetum coccineum]|uniref:Reverse transcriptase domain-containing protein n=1 Tax=Tanacetum coccineum TaxID=301880 RepID=A0ABQ5IZI5_9ASTR
MEISRFTQKFEELVLVNWERFRSCLEHPHHRFTELTQVDTFYNGLNENEQDSLNAAAGGNLLSKTTREALNIIENKSKVRYSRNRSDASRMSATSSKTDERIDKLADQLSTLIEIVSKKVVTPAPVKAVEESCVTCGGAHSWYNCPATDNNQASVCATTGTYNQVNPPNRVSNQDVKEHAKSNQPLLKNLKNEIQNTIKSQQAVMMNQQTTFQNNLQNMICRLFQNQASTLGTLPSNTIPNPKGEMKAITTRSGVAYEGPLIPTNPSLKELVERETEETTDKEQTHFQGSTAQIPPPVIPISILESDIPKILPKTTPILESDIPKNLPKPNIPYPSRCDDQKSRDKASNQMEKSSKSFKIYASTLLLELAKIPLNENCSAMLLKKLPEKLGDPDKFLIPCNFPGMDVCHALADLGASINLMPLSIWKKLSLPDLTPTRMTLEFRSLEVSRLILGRSFLRTSRALIDVYEGELVLRDGNEQITFHVNGTSKHPQKHENESIKMVNDACKDSFKRFTDEPTQVCPPPSKDVNNKKEKQEVKNLAEPTVKRQTCIIPCLKNFRVICKESRFHSNKTPQVSSVFAITSTLPSIEPKDSLIMGDEHRSTFSTKEIVPIRESEETSRSDSKNVLPSCDDFSSIKVPRDNSMTFSNPLFEFDVNFNNPLFDEDIECKDSYDSNLDDFPTPRFEFPSTPLKSVASILEGFIEDPPIKENDDLFDSKCKTNDEAECFNPGGDNDKIDAFLAIKVPTNEPENEPLITFSPKSDPLHHEFTGELITIPPGIVREKEDYINRMSLLCSNSSSPSPENFHTIIESLPISTTRIEDSDPNREEIDIFSGPDDSIPPGIESDFDSEEDIIDNLLNNDSTHERLTFNIEPKHK